MKAQEAFLEMFDKVGNDIIDEGGHLSEELFDMVDEDSGVYLDEVILYAEIGDVISDETVGNGDNHVEFEAVLQVSDRFFRLGYIGVGKDLDEYMEYEIAEVVPKAVVKIEYVLKGEQ